MVMHGKSCCALSWDFTLMMRVPVNDLPIKLNFTFLNIIFLFDVTFSNHVDSSRNYTDPEHKNKVF